jgi:uncharacterized membrane protein (DUF485 family)
VTFDFLAAKQDFAWPLSVVGLALFLLFTVLETTESLIFHHQHSTHENYILPILFFYFGIGCLRSADRRAGGDR